jgi:hypothetical protein
MLEPVHFSTLKHIQRSPAHYQAASNAEPSKAHERKGTALHSMVIGNPEDVVVWGNKRDPRNKEYQAFMEANDGRHILSGKEYDVAEEMSAAIRRHPAAMELLVGHREQQINWEWLGRRCSGTPDVFSLEHVVELKTCRTAHPERFMSAAKFYGYHAQLAWYRRGLIESGFGTPASAWIVAVESAPPFPVTVFRMTDNALELGERMCRAWLERLLVCEASDQWPAYAESAVPFDIEDDSGFTLTIDGEETEVA